MIFYRTLMFLYLKTITMKRIFHIIILFFGLIILTTSCDFILYGKGMGNQMQYHISFVFQDAAGNNLAEGIGVEDMYPDMPKEQVTDGKVVGYKLDIILSDPGDFNTKQYPFYDEASGKVYDPPILKYKHTEDNNIYIENNFCFYTGVVKPQEKLIYEITCPHIFGDDKVHVITTYWTGEQGETIFSSFFPVCYKVEFEGKIITDIRYDLPYTYKNNVTLTVNR